MLSERNVRKWYMHQHGWIIQVQMPQWLRSFLNWPFLCRYVITTYDERPTVWIRCFMLSLWINLIYFVPACKFFCRHGRVPGKPKNLSQRPMWEYTRVVQMCLPARFHSILWRIILHGYWRVFKRNVWQWTLHKYGGIVQMLVRFGIQVIPG